MSEVIGIYSQVEYRRPILIIKSLIMVKIIVLNLFYAGVELLKKQFLSRVKENIFELLIRNLAKFPNIPSNKIANFQTAMVNYNWL